MIEVTFTVDYEIYGNGSGSLQELIYEPALKLKEIFDRWNAPLVVFVEAAELEKIESERTDPAIDLVIDQIRNFHDEGYEIGLHLHPQWYNAEYKNGIWVLDYSEYNLCVLPEKRMAEIVDRSIEFLRRVLDDDGFIPLSFRAGNWLLQPTRIVSRVLAGSGIKIDSSVFKGGLQHKNNLDYRPSLKNGYYWKFSKDVNIEDSEGTLLEVPIYAEMVPIWKMATSKRVGLQHKGPVSGVTENNLKTRVVRMMDFLRFRYPLKYDFCRMTLSEAIGMVDRVIERDKKDPTSFRPIVAIGHTKDLVDFDTVDSLLAYLRKKQIPISTFEDVYPKCV